MPISQVTFSKLIKRVRRRRPEVAGPVRGRHEVRCSTADHRGPQAVLPQWRAATQETAFYKSFTQLLSYAVLMDERSDPMLHRRNMIETLP